MSIAVLDVRVPSAGADDIGRTGRTGGVIRVTTLLRVAMAVMITAQIGRIPVLSAGAKEAPILINDLFLLVVVVGAALVAMRNRRITLDTTACLALLFAVIGGVSAILAVQKFGLSPFEYFFSTAYLLRWLLYFGIYLVCTNFVRRAEVFTVWGALEFAILFFAGFGIFQAIFLPGFAQMVYPSAELYLDWDPQGHRLVSTFLDPNFAGALIAIGLLLLLARASLGVAVPIWKLLLLFVALLLTLSRSSFLAFLVGLLVIGLVRGRSKRLWQIGAVLLVLGAPGLPFLIEYGSSFNRFSIDASAMTRVVSWLMALDIVADHPIIGVGFNTYGFVQERYGGSIFGQAAFGLDGGILFIAVMTGVLGVSVYVLMLASVFRRCRRVWNDSTFNDDERGFCLGVGTITVAIVVHSMFLNSLLYPFLMEVLWILWGLSYVLSRGEERPRSETRSESGIVQSSPRWRLTSQAAG